MSFSFFVQVFASEDFTEEIAAQYLNNTSFSYSNNKTQITYNAYFDRECDDGYLCYYNDLYNNYHHAVFSNVLAPGLYGAILPKSSFIALSMIFVGSLGLGHRFARNLFEKNKKIADLLSLSLIDLNNNQISSEDDQEAFDSSNDQYLNLSNTNDEYSSLPVPNPDKNPIFLFLNKSEKDFIENDMNTFEEDSLLSDLSDNHDEFLSTENSKFLQILQKYKLEIHYLHSQYKSSLSSVDFQYYLTDSEISRELQVEKLVSFAVDYINLIEKAIINRLKNEQSYLKPKELNMLASSINLVIKSLKVYKLDYKSQYPIITKNHVESGINLLPIVGLSYDEGLQTVIANIDFEEMFNGFFLNLEKNIEFNGLNQDIIESESLSAKRKKQKISEVKDDINAYIKRLELLKFVSAKHKNYNAYISSYVHRLLDNYSKFLDLSAKRANANWPLENQIFSYLVFRAAFIDSANFLSDFPRIVEETQKIISANLDDLYGSY